ncbi:MAG: mechanosensitive ion channel family protein [Sulfitobacter sp.]
MARKFKTAMALYLMVMVLVGPLAMAQAQGLPSLVPDLTDSTEADKVAEVLRQAKENGIGVVVINDAGELLSSVGEAPSDGAEVLPEGSQLMALQDATLKFRGALIERLLGLPDAFREVAYILRAASPDGTIAAFFQALVYSLLLFGAGMFFEIQVFGKRIAKGYVTARILENPVGYAEKMPFLVFRFFFGVIGILVSMAVAYAIGGIFFGPLEDTAMQFTVSLINAAYFFSRFVAGLWRMILSPYLEQYRIPALDNHEAKRLHKWLWMLGAFDICAILFGIWIGELGLNYDVFAFLTSLLSGFLVVLNIVMVLVNGKAISCAICGGKSKNEVSWLARTVATFWAPIVISYVVFAWVKLTYDLVLGHPPTIPLVAGAYGILLSIIVVYGVINFAIERGFMRARALRSLNAAQADEMLDEEGDERAPLTAAESDAKAMLMPRPAISTYEALARRVAGILAFVAGSYAFLVIWDNDSTRMAESLFERLLDVLVIVFIGYIVYHVFRIWIDGKIAEEQGDADEEDLGGEGGGTGASRLATLLPLFRNFMLIVVLVTILLIILLEIGINVGPLFAGAGVVGVAVGFGSQALVRDIFSGGFFLFDDAFRKGEYLDVGGVKGTVEKISVRSFQLRHHLGALHTIPFGEIQVLTNYSRDWVIMKLPLRVTYDTDVEKVRKLIKNLGVQLLDDPVIGDNFIQPLKSQGVIEMQDSAMIIRVKFMTKPGDQWLVRKKVYEDIRALFEREGIRFAHREVTVRLADGKVDDLTDEQRKSVTAAAQASVEEDIADAATDEGDDR